MRKKPPWNAAVNFHVVFLHWCALTWSCGKRILEALLITAQGSSLTHIWLGAHTVS